MNCKNLRLRSKGYIKYYYCLSSQKEIKILDCYNCKYKQIKQYKPLIVKTPLKKSDKPMKQKTYKQTKLERDRFSLFTDNMTKCYFHKDIIKDSTHEIFRGRNRSNSMKYGLCLPLCHECHSKYQDDVKFNEEWHTKGQKAFNKKYPDLKFEDIFKINYL